MLELPDFATDSSAVVAPPDRSFKDSIAGAAYDEAGLGPEDLSLAEVYDLSTALELDWYENIGLCGEGEAEALLRSGDTELGGRIPVNPSGGLACFGEAIPAQAIAQVCEVTWQLRGQAGPRQVEGAGRNHRQPGLVRTWVVRDRQQLRDAAQPCSESGTAKRSRPTTRRRSAAVLGERDGEAESTDN